MQLGLSRKRRWEIKLNETHQLQVYDDDVNLLGDDVDAINKCTETLIATNKEIVLK
jgi:hypothetical protein